MAFLILEGLKQGADVPVVRTSLTSSAPPHPLKCLRGAESLGGRRIGEGPLKERGRHGEGQREQLREAYCEIWLRGHR